jgi:SHS family lactate transporter-like MFS transporter
MTERFPTGARPTASTFFYYLGTIFGGIVPPVVTYFAGNYDLGFSIPMLVGYFIGGASWCSALFLGPETKGKDMMADLVLA